MHHQPQLCLDVASLFGDVALTALDVIPGPALTNASNTPTGKPVPTASPARALWKRAAVGLGLIALMAGGGALLMDASIDHSEDAALQSGTTRHELLGEVRSWGYQLQGLDVAAAARSNFDLLVVDEEIEPQRSPQRRADALKALKRKPDGSRRLVLAYLSIGEAEEYRDYWRRDWVTAGMPPPLREAGLATLPGSSANATPLPKARGDSRPMRVPSPAAPAWLGDENRQWPGNFRVRYWEEAWQSLMYGNERAALDRIIGAGFDGIYLDRADAFNHWARERQGAKGDMASLIERLSARAREISPGFIVAMQNAEELLGSNRARKAIDLVAKEDLLFGVAEAGQPNSDSDVASSVRYLKKAQGSGLPILVVEYLDDEATIADARRRIQRLGFIPYFAPRALDRLQTAN